MGKGLLVNHFKNEEVAMKSGDVLIMKPYVLHVLENAGQRPARKAYCCSFLPQAVEGDIRSLEELQNSNSPNRYFFKSILSLNDEGVSAIQLKIDSARRGELAAIFQHLLNASHGHTARDYALTRYHLLSLLCFLSGEYEANQLPNKTVGNDLAVPVSRYMDGLRKTLSYIHDHFDQPLSLKNMATMSGASETYFCRLFKHETGMTLLGYLNGLRIEKACQLLRDTSENALDICYTVGFNDYTHFGRQFRKTMGMSPADFRRKNQHVRRIREM